MSLPIPWASPSLPSILLPVLLPILLATYCSAISLSPCPSLLTRNTCSHTEHAILHRQDQREWASLSILVPAPLDLLAAHWVLFWRVPTRLVVVFIGWGLRDLLPDAEDLVLSTEL
ncbi:hypothetical protein F4804DRAFT_332999 [Jackrogersella minutella]|nr:hypothetical protein F4804DRAFT_332999 [Jackrogersella minutella]